MACVGGPQRVWREVEVMGLHVGDAVSVRLEARDRFGNVDENFEREVALDHEGKLPEGEEIELPHAGVVHLKQGTARLQVKRKPPPKSATEPS